MQLKYINAYSSVPEWLFPLFIKAKILLFIHKWLTSILSKKCFRTKIVPKTKISPKHPNWSSAKTIKSSSPTPKQTSISGVSYKNTLIAKSLSRPFLPKTLSRGVLCKKSAALRSLTTPIICRAKPSRSDVTQERLRSKTKMNKK